MVNRKVYLSAVPLLLLFSANALALDSDTGRQIWRSTEQNINRTDDNLPDAVSPMLPDILELDGKKYQVQHTVNDVGMALYLSINHRQWQQVNHYLQLYQQMAGHDPLLVLFARGELAQQAGDLTAAERDFKEILKQNPAFTLVSLELGRVYFADQQNRESLAVFNQLLADEQQLTPAIINNISLFSDALKLRESWRGSISFGYEYNTNVNMSSNFPTLESSFEINGTRYTWQRKLPKPVKSGGLVFQAAINRRWQLSGHHGIFFRALGYGENYFSYHQQNENLASVTTGYSFKDQKNEFNLGGVYEYDNIGNKTRYQAAGASAEWTRMLTSQVGINLEADYKNMHYVPAYHGYNGSLTALYSTLYWSPADNTTFFTGVDQSWRRTALRYESYQQTGVRAGISHMFSPGVQAIAFTTFRHRNFAEYTDLLGTLRKDNEQLYSAQLKIPAWKLLTLTPVITYRYRKNSSTADWLYSYNRHELLLQFERFF